MDVIKREWQIYICLGLMLAIWVVILRATGTPLSINWEALKKLPDAVTVFVLISFLFTKWLWRWRMFRGWLVRIPDLEGTWDGQFQSTWKNPTTNEGIPSRRMILVIRQTISSVSCTVFTKESESYSRAAQVVVEDESGSVTISYNYTNRSNPTLRVGSAIHDGAAHLRFISKPERKLQGEYWTGRCTTGHMDLKFTRRDLQESFPVTDT
jgi:hypothetical protein